MNRQRPNAGKLSQEQEQELALAAARVQIALLRYEIASQKHAAPQPKKRKVRL